jgi:non-specific serine/threonine protein kinase
MLHLQDSPAEPERRSAPPATGMPTYLTRLVGRDGDRSRLRDLLIERGHRLVVVTGPGGVGKTRLAVQVATDLQERFQHGARFLALAAVPADADLDAALAWRLGLRDVQGQSHRETIAAWLQPREMLLVIDNAEHVLAVAGLLTFIHRRCPAVAMLVTSRRTLDVYGEAVHQLSPLTHRATGSPRTGAGPDRPPHNPAMQLFRDRVRALDPGFEITPANAPTIAAICEHLGGLPLAIELTAPRLAHRTPAALLAELEATGASFRRTARSRVAASIQDTIRRSYDQLEPNQQRVFRTLCIMCGRWMVEDVLPVLPPDIAEIDAIDELDALVRRSMLTSASSDDEVRFTVNPLLRRFGRELLDELGEARAVADRHAARMVRLAESAEPELTGPGQRWWLSRLEYLHDDLHDAHQHLLDHDRPVDALRLATALWRYGYTRGHYREIRRMIETALAGVDGHDALRSRALNGVGLLTIMLRDADGAREAHQQALALAMPLGLDREVAIARIGLADIDATVANDTAAALRHLQFAMAAYERLGDARGMASVLTNRGYIEWQLGQLDVAFATHEEAGVLYTRASDTRGIAWSRTNTGRIAAQQGRFREAVPRLLAGLEGYVPIGDVSGVAEVLEALAAVAAGTGDLGRASTLLGAAATARAGIGSALSGLDLAQRDATLAAARRGAEHEAAYARGTSMGIEEAIALARSFPVPAAPPESPPPDARWLARERFGITPREYQVLALLDEGLTNNEIAARLGVSPRTVQAHTQALLRKLDVGSRGAAVYAAHQAGIIAARPHEQASGPDR